ncbi:hypothetical protein [Flavobacterium psychrophilum]|uniref:Uncharacterized protein n=1 Tax=Flavobacterium psychrophilum TaxID=96345 RepID=A0A7U2NFB2_FLAPS|nr:hypothetical protein [Flavobacterium psychrophilum]OUD23233.1 hypothetical protein FPG92_13165 [Flavobacterium psychrophilum]QRE03477.1 hypothetical protein H0H26_11390 [Flavobacterium psychrophilum]
MKIEKIKERIAKIETCKSDDEMAHCYEDDLFYDFVNAIKNGKYETKEEIVKAAKEVYKVRKISFARWHA